MKIIKGENADIIQIAENQTITIIKIDKPYPCRPLKTVKYKNQLNLEDAREFYNYLKELFSPDGGTQNGN